MPDPDEWMGDTWLGTASTVRFGTMGAAHPLRTILEDAARGRFPPPDGSVDVLPSPPSRADAVVAFTAHHVIAADVDPDEVRGHLPDTDLGAPLSAGFLAWLGARVGSAPGSVDVVLAAPGRESEEAELLLQAGTTGHDRVDRAARYREDVHVYADPDGAAVVALGSGLAGRREIALEIDGPDRFRGLGRRLILAARTLIPRDEFVFAQVAAGNAASLRAFLSAGFTPIGSEVLFLR